jgi:hypothetical protein
MPHWWICTIALLCHSISGLVIQSIGPPSLNMNAGAIRTKMRKYSRMLWKGSCPMLTQWGIVSLLDEVRSQTPPPPPTFTWAAPQGKMCSVAGCVQYMSAGTGVAHSEMNDGDSTCRFIQVWLTPDKRGHAPQYGSSQYENEDRHNCLLHILGGTGEHPVICTTIPLTPVPCRYKCRMHLWAGEYFETSPEALVVQVQRLCGRAFAGHRRT